MTTEVVAKAAAFAKAAHESIDQRRKYTNQPYIVHPETVANMVSRVTNDVAIIAAAWLHDVVEDTPTTIHQIAREFGDDISNLVADLTDVSEPSDGNRRERNAIDRQHTATADPRAKTVKLADIIDNLTGIARLAPGFAVKYVAEKELLLQVLKDGDQTLFKRAVAVIADVKRELAKTKKAPPGQRKR